METCDGAGECQPGALPELDDGDPCTVDSCDPINGVQHAPAIEDDANPCTIDSCDSNGDAVHTPAPLGASCTDGDACNGEETCDGAGVCLSGTPIDLDDGNPCTRGTCSPETGYRPVALRGGTSCADADACDGEEICDGAGVCEPGTPPRLDDGDPCTADVCEALTGVVHEYSDSPECRADRSGWTLVAGSTPSPRDSAAVVYASAIDAVVLFGGENAGVALGETWIWAPGQEWSLVAGQGPRPRAGASAVYDSNRDRLLLFGGAEGSGTQATFLADTWEFDVDTRTWLRVDAVASPPARAYAAMAFDSVRDRVVLFGGTGAQDYDDTWEWDPDVAEWREAHPAVSPSPRAGATLTYDDAQRGMLLVGGAPDALAAQPRQDTWWYDGERWTEVAGVDAPLARVGHSVIYDSRGSRYVAFGGVDAAASAELWTFTLADSAWVRSDVEGAPAARAGHSAVYDASASRMIVVSGLTYSQTGRSTPAFGDVWLLDLADAAASWQQFGRGKAPARIDRGLVHDPVRHVLVAASSSSGGATDVWEYDPQRLRWEVNRTLNQNAPRSSTGQGAAYYDERRQRVSAVDAALAVWDWTGSAWELRECSSEKKHPMSFTESASAYDASSGRLYRFGGVARRGVGFVVDDYYGAAHWARMWVMDTDTCGWRRAPEHGTPPALRKGAAMAWDGARGVVVLFGGATRDCNSGQACLLSDTWEYEPVSGDWTVVPGDVHPEARAGASLAFDSTTGAVVLFGGYANAGTLSPLGDTWAYDTGSKVWQRVASNDEPAARRGASLVFDPDRGRAVLAGGIGVEGFPLADMWELDGQVWREINVSGHPSARNGAAAAWEPTSGVGIAFGGVNGSGDRHYLGDTWIWSNGWRLVRDAEGFVAASGWVSTDDSKAPSPRAGHAMSRDAYGDGQVLLFGGEDDQGPRADTWTFDPKSQGWTRHDYWRNPPARTEHAISALPDAGYLIFGGEGETGLLGDTWLLRSGRPWALPQGSSATAPSARRSHALATDVARNQVVLFGGIDEAGASAETWLYDIAAGTWSKRTSLRSPEPRFGHTMTYDPIREVVVLTGGAGTAPARSYAATWEWDGVDWRRRRPDAEYLPTAGHLAFFDERAGELIISGGLRHAVGGDAAATHAGTFAFERADGSDEQRLRALGESCQAADQCASDHCADGYCCNVACSGQCSACNVEGAEGTCAAVTGEPVGSRVACEGPDGECGSRCNGVEMNACHVAPVGTECGALGCDAGVLHRTRGTCDGTSSCVGGEPFYCEPYACVDGGCASRCWSDADCFSSDYACSRAYYSDSTGQCERRALIETFQVLPNIPTVGQPAVLSASASGSARYEFRHLEGGYYRSLCGGTQSGATCAWTPDTPGTHAFEVRTSRPGIYTPDDKRRITIEVVEAP